MLKIGNWDQTYPEFNTTLKAVHKIKKIGLAFLFGSIGVAGFSQGKPVIYGGADYYRNKSFVANSYFNLNVGSQLFQWRFIAPEVGYEYHFGIVRDNNEVHPEEPNARAPSKVRSRFSTHTFSVAPKIIIGNEEAAFVFIPQYNIGNIKARRELLKDSGTNYFLTEQERVSNPINFWSFAAGVEGQFFDSDILLFAFLIKYHLLNTEDTFKEIELKNSDLKTTGGFKDGIGISFRVYFDVLQLFNAK